MTSWPIEPYKGLRRTRLRDSQEVVIHLGKVLKEGLLAEVADDVEVIQAYLGKATPMLQVRELHAGYGKSEVLRGISFDVQRGEIVTIVAANGAGKATTLRTLCGIVPATTGYIELDGVPLDARQPHEIVELGVTMIPEGRQLFPFLTVEENGKDLLVNPHIRKAYLGH